MNKNITSFTVLIVTLTLLIASKSFSQQGEKRFDFESDLEFNPDIPSPSDFFGYEPGETYTFYHDGIDYLKTLDKLSPLISLREYGETYERRKLVYIIITSEENQNNLETIRQSHLKLMNPLLTPKKEAESMIPEQPIVISLSYNIHGNEACGMEAAIQVAYRLCAAKDPEMLDVLSKSVVIMFPCINPDGHDRYTYWYRSMAQQFPATDPKELEHDEAWPNGRTNHYWFDLNRDWFWGVHPESRGHSGIIQQWLPQIHVDNHEQGYDNNYFTMPGTTPRNKLLPDAWEQFASAFGKANIEAFNKHNITYSTHEAYDFFFPGYGSSYPGLLGAIAMLTEQGGIGAGRAIRSKDGYILTLRQRIFDHYTTSLATILKAASLREDLLHFTFNALNPANSKTKTKAYLLPDNSSGYLYKLIKTLRRNEIEIEQSTKAFTVKNALDYQSGKIASKKFESGTFIIKTAQNRHMMINTILARNLLIEDSVTYDMLSWSAPMAYNLEAYSTDQELQISTVKLEANPKIPTGLNNPDAHYAYIIDWKQSNAPKALSQLWEKGYRVRIAGKPFRSDNKSYARGSVIVLMGRNSEKTADATKDMREISVSCQVLVDGFDSGQMLEGPDLGSRYNRPVKIPKVAMLVGSPFSTYLAGEIWFLFDRITNFTVSRIRASSISQSATNIFPKKFGNADLNDYDVLILPAGGRQIKSVFPETKIKQLKEWVMRGGTLIAEESAVNWLTKEQSGFTDIHLVKAPKDTSEQAKYLRFEQREDFYGLKRIPGAALRASIDNSNPLAFGLDEDLYTIKFGTNALKPSIKMQTAGYYLKDSSKLLTAGYSSKENLNQLAGQAFAGVVPMGKGKVVLLLDKTQFRMFWIGPSRMIQNAVMIIPGF